MITMDKQYRYRGPGVELDRVLCTDRKAPNSPVVSISIGGGIYTHTSDGRFNDVGPPKESPFDLIEVIQLWRGKVWVRDRDGSCIGHATTDPGFRHITAVEERKGDA